jgi:hypothetical protein
MACSSYSYQAVVTLNPAVIAAYHMARGEFDGLLQDAGGKPLAIYG